jgi:glutathione S-transferase
MLKLFHGPNSCSLATLIVLEESGTDYEVITVNLGAGEQNRPEYRAINPKGRVPALVTDQGILTESPALMSYVAMRFPSANLAPVDDVFAFAKMQSFNAGIRPDCARGPLHRRSGGGRRDKGQGAGKRGQQFSAYRE